MLDIFGNFDLPIEKITVKAIAGSSKSHIFPALCYCLITPEIQLLSNQILAQNTKYNSTYLILRWAFVMKWPPFSSSCFVSLVLVWPYHWNVVKILEKKIVFIVEGVSPLLKYGSQEKISFCCRCSSFLSLTFVEIKKSFTKMLLSINYRNFEIFFSWKKTDIS